MKHFEKYYVSHQNHGLNQMEKNQELIQAKELFNAWDINRIGSIQIDFFVENLISFGLALDKKQVIRLVQILDITLFDNQD
jgi:hypothetical protein